MTASSLSDTDKEIMDMTVRSAQNLIQLKAMLTRQSADIRKLWSEQRSLISIINKYRKELGDAPLARAESSSSSDSSIQSIDQAPINTSTLSETCRNYLLVRDSVLKDLQVVQQQEASRKRDRSLDLSIEEISPPSKRPVKERLGTRQDDSSQVLQGSSNQPEVNLSTKFTIQNDSLKETDNSVVNVSSTSSSTGVASDSSEAPPLLLPNIRDHLRLTQGHLLPVNLLLLGELSYPPFRNIDPEPHWLAPDLLPLCLFLRLLHSGPLLFSLHP